MTSSHHLSAMTSPSEADPLMRAACARLLEQPPALLPPDPAALAAGLARVADSGLDVVLQRLIADAPEGSATDALAALLRPPMPAWPWDEAQEIDWAVRHWQACRDAGLLDEELAADFGEYWRRIEWSAIRQHLALLATLDKGHPQERRLLALIAKTSARYVALGFLKRAMEARYPEFFDLGFSLR